MEKQQAHEYKMRKLELDHELEMAKVQAGISSNNAAISANNLHLMMLDRSSKEHEIRMHEARANHDIRVRQGQEDMARIDNAGAATRLSQYMLFLTSSQLTALALAKE